MKQRGRVLLGTLLLTGSAVAVQSGQEPTDTAVPPPASATADDVAPAVDTALLELAAGLIVPVKGVAAADLRGNFYDMRGSRRHNALDILAPKGTPVLSATGGRVLQLQKNGQGGRMVFATDPSERFILLYAHLDDYAEGLEAGMPLVRGQVLGSVGTSGNAPPNTPHLHFAIKRAGDSLRWSRGTPIDPHPLLVPLALAGSSNAGAPEQAR